MAHPDRIDFRQLADGRVNVLKFERRDGRDVPLPDGHSLKPASFSLADALTWCEGNGYVVRRWEGGARAWKADKPWVIRTRGQILRIRRRNSCKVNLDFAYDG